jgi:hypothetical protein
LLAGFLSLAPPVDNPPPNAGLPAGRLPRAWDNRRGDVTRGAMSERKVAPHVARAIGAAQAKPIPSSAPQTAHGPAPAAHVRQAVAALQAKPAPPGQARAAQHVRAAVAAPRAPAIPPPIQAKPAPGSKNAGRRSPLPAFAPGKVVQRMEHSYSEDEFELDSEEAEEADREEAQHEKLLDIKERQKECARVAKPKGLAKRFYDHNPSFAPSSPVREEDVYEERDNPKKQKPHGFGKVAAVHKIPCSRCGLPIRMTKDFKELGVGFKEGKRKKPPMGHILDFSIYKIALELHIESNVPEKYQNAYRKIATWDQANLGLEHFDCNARAKKVTSKNITTDQEDKGSKLVVKCHARWLKEAMEEVDG